MEGLAITQQHEVAMHGTKGMGSNSKAIELTSKFVIVLQVNVPNQETKKREIGFSGVRRGRTLTCSAVEKSFYIFSYI